jgi:hypothetical protein
MVLRRAGLGETKLSSLCESCLGALRITQSFEKLLKFQAPPYYTFADSQSYRIAAPALKKGPELVEKAVEPINADETIEPPATEPELPVADPLAANTVGKIPVEPALIEEREVAITPSKDELTEDNLEQVPDTSG